jgi:hypothetical protein
MYENWNKQSPVDRVEGVELKPVVLKIHSDGRPFFSRWSLPSQKKIVVGMNNFHPVTRKPKKEGFLRSVFEGVELKLLVLKFILKARHQSYMEFAISKIIWTGA